MLVMFPFKVMELPAKMNAPDGDLKVRLPKAVVAAKLLVLPRRVPPPKNRLSPANGARPAFQLLAVSQKASLPLPTQVLSAARLAVGMRPHSSNAIEILAARPRK